MIRWYRRPRLDAAGSLQKRGQKIFLDLFYRHAAPDRDQGSILYASAHGCRFCLHDCWPSRQYAARSHHLYFARKLLVWGSQKRLIGPYLLSLNRGESPTQASSQGRPGALLRPLPFRRHSPARHRAWTGILAASILDMDSKRV